MKEFLGIVKDTFEKQPLQTAATGAAIVFVTGYFIRSLKA
jgi:hypothetical protein